MLRISLLFCSVLGVYSSSAPFITPCRAGDAACTLASASAAVPAFAAGLPALGVARLDPMWLPLVQSDHAGLKLKFFNTTLTGLKDSVFEAVTYNAQKQKQSVTLKCSLVLKGHYTLDGKLLILPVQGNGPFTIVIRDMVIKLSIGLATVTGEDGLPHWHISKWRHSFKVLTNVKFEFENLFNGNQALALPVVQFANNDWSAVMDEVAPPVIKSIVSDIVENVERLYAAVPLKDLVAE